MRESRPQAPWPSRFPAWTMLFLLVAGGVGCLAFTFWGHRNPTQAFYLRDYVKTSIHAPKGRYPYRLIQKDGSVGFHVVEASAFNAVVGRVVYGNQPLYMVLEFPLIAFGVAAFLGLLIGGNLDSRRLKEAMAGVLIRGPRLVSRYEFNRETRGE